MITIEEKMQQLSDDQLELAYLENEEWRKTGILQDGVLRNLHNEFCEETGMKSTMIHLISEPLMYELVKRYRTQLKK